MLRYASSYNYQVTQIFFYVFSNRGHTRRFLCGQIERLKHSRCKVVWCDWEGKPSSWTGLLPSVDMVFQSLAFASSSMLHFKNPYNFLAGNLTKCLPH